MARGKQVLHGRASNAMEACMGAVCGARMLLRLVEFVARALEFVLQKSKKLNAIHSQALLVNSAPMPP